MSNFKYVTPYWRDSQELFGEGFGAYTGTTFFILNYNNETASIRIHFYDLDGKRYDDMEVGMLIPARTVLDVRIVDVISFKNPGYRLSNNQRTGSISILSTLPLSISGRMYRGRSGADGARDENVWSIPFEEVKIAETDIRSILDEPAISASVGKEYFNRRRKPR